MRFIFSLFFFVSMVQPSMATTYTDCNRAIENGDIETAKNLSQLILRFNSVTDPRDQIAGSLCLTFATGKKHIFDIVSGKFSEISAEEESFWSNGQLEEAGIALHYADKRQANEVERKRVAAEAADRQRQSERLKAKEKAKVQAVLSRVVEVCNELYAQEPVEALTRKICLDIFLQTGLPDE